MDNNLILPGGAIVVDNTLMKVQPKLLYTQSLCRMTQNPYTIPLCIVLEREGAIDRSQESNGIKDGFTP